ncbi:hypothetical protein A0H76_2071 [Hepatospora eriocheir]|uniref:Uncharacterized protein n=2 Tax=Hepatospora eriocheir TaxID=1081669 RepID=A0A1X0QG31_9MICR|nr:hypothetical protein A0H76_2071 [Hepatospora eriocheir]
MLNPFVLRIKLSENNLILNETMISSMEFTEMFINSIINKFNTRFNDFYSVNEFANRTKLIEMINLVKNDLDRFILVMYAFYIYDEVKLLTKQKFVYDCFHFNVIDAGEYLRFTYENIKTSFVPSADVTLALMTYFDKNYCKEKESIKFDNKNKDLDKLAKILLFRQNLKNINYVQNGRFLELTASNLKIKLGLYGTIEHPSWIIISVEGFNEKVLKMIKTNFNDKLNNLIDFMSYYKLKVKAREIYNQLTNKTGDLLKFTGKYKNNLIRGELTNENKLNIFVRNQTEEYKINSLKDLK